MWRLDGGLEQNYKNGLCNAIKNCSNPAKYSAIPDDGENDYKNLSDTCYCEEHKNFQYASHYKLIAFVPYHLKIFI